jgi:CRP-like cAMP-binding protein
MEELLTFLNAISAAEGWPLSTACLDFLPTIIKKLTLKKGEYLLVPGQVCENLYFIQKGLLKCFYVVHGKAVSDWFFGEMETVVSIDSFYDQVPGEDFIEAIEDCELFYISFPEFQHLYRTYVEFNVIGRVLTNKYLRLWHRQARNIRMLSAKERYLFLLKNQPDLIKRVEVQDLASYLDMSRETLSRMRGDIH